VDYLILHDWMVKDILSHSLMIILYLYISISYLIRLKHLMLLRYFYLLFDKVETLNAFKIYKVEVEKQKGKYYKVI